jgi:hypothetical protein
LCDRLKGGTYAAKIGEAPTRAKRVNDLDGHRDRLLLILISGPAIEPAEFFCDPDKAGV